MNESEKSKELAPLRFTVGTEHIWKALSELPRTGWVMRGVPEPESVKEHTESLIRLAREIAPELLLTEVELEELLAILEVHDWPEVLAGDTVILGSEPDADELRKKKKQAESAAMRELAGSLPNGERILALYERYDSGADKVASLAKQLDKLQAVMLAREYEDAYGIEGVTAEFIEYSKRYITEPVLVERMNECVR